MNTNDTDSPDPERLWGHAITRWQNGDPEAVCALVGKLRIPEFAREFLTDLASGKAYRPEGRPSARTGEQERAIGSAVYALQGEGKSLKAAQLTVAEQFKLTRDQVRGLMDKLQAEGFTLEFWR